jgi:hypothetical protein
MDFPSKNADFTWFDHENWEFHMIVTIKNWKFHKDFTKKRKFHPFHVQAWQFAALQIRRPQHPQHIRRHDGRHQPGTEAHGHARAPAVQATGGANGSQAMGEGHLAEVGLVTASGVEVAWGKPREMLLGRLVEDIMEIEW